MHTMTAMDAAVKVLESEGVDTVFGIPGAAILPLYQALRGSPIRHHVVRHEEGGTHAAEGYTRARSGAIGVCIGTSGPAGTNMVTGLYSAIADSVPILCITGQAPRAKLADPKREVVGIVGDYSFQFLIEELAVAAQYHIPFVLVVLNNSYLGLIRQAQRAYEMESEVRLGFANINCPEIGEYGVDHVKAVEAFGGIARRVFDPASLGPTLQWARDESRRQGLPVVVEVITEQVTNTAMGSEIDKVTEFEEIVDAGTAHCRQPVSA